MAKIDGLIIPPEILKDVSSSLVKKGNKTIKYAEDVEDNEPTDFVKSILNELNGSKNSIHRLAFTTDPNHRNSFSGLYKQRLRLLPPYVLKRIAVQDDLVASILQARQNHISAFGRPRPDRFEKGFVIEPKQSALELIENEVDSELKIKKKEELRKRIADASKMFLNCGHTSGWEEKDRLSFPQYLSQSVRNLLVLGMFSTEVVWRDLGDGNKKFYGFRVIDAGTIFRATPYSQMSESIRKEALPLLENLNNEKLTPEKFKKEEYTWIQVVDGRPLQAFTSNECLVHMYYAVPDIEMDGYPITPIDTVISAITTHINITTHNKLYFQHGRASKGMLVITSDDADDRVLRNIKQQFNASINSAQNSWRMPVFSVGIGEDLKWQPIDNSSRDMEFQYLMDMNARVVLSAFMISPEEIPGWAYLSRGTASQSLSESNNEYQLLAARDVGIRPLLQSMEDFLNSSIFPLIDPVLAEMATIRLMGLNAETAEREGIRLQQDMQVHLTMDEILEKVEKRAIGKFWGGEFLFNPNYQSILDRYFTVGEIKETFFDRKNASRDPRWDYARDAFFFQQQQLLQANQQMQMQVQMQQQAQSQASEQNSEPQEIAKPEENDKKDELSNNVDTAVQNLNEDED